MGKKLTKEEFIERARNVHGNKYDYSKVNYLDSKTKVCIICPEHGEFEQLPGNHLQGQGCSSCYGNIKKTTGDFIKLARIKHGSKYDYSQVKYVNNRTKVKIICPIHGEFEQTPHHHILGNGCPDCGKLTFGNKRKLTKDEFVERARKVHGNKYDYSKVEYQDVFTEIKIICPIHGEFEQTPHNHFKYGCGKCGGTKRLTLFNFIQKAKEIHGDKYNYSKVKYKNNRTKVKIICPEHGEFEQTPDNHFSGKGCFECSKEKGIETKRRNGTLNTSQPEENLYELLVDKFGKANVVRQYKESRYPYSCDFYIKSLDLFIELNASQYHNGHWFDKNNVDDLEQLKIFQERASKSEHNQYHEIIKTWTQRDPLKKKTATQNNLNYKVFWDCNLTDVKEWLNSI